MCLPVAALALIGAGLSAAGTAAKFIGDKKAADARNNAMNQERDRQQAFQREQNAKFQDSLDKTKGVTDPASIAAAAAAREGTLAGVIVPQGGEGTYVPGSSSAPTVVADAAGKASARSAANSASLAHAIAALSGTGDQMQALNTGIGRNSAAIGQLGGFAGGSVGVLDSELHAADQKGATWRGLGGLAQQIGQAAMMHGAGGAGSAVFGKGMTGASSILSRYGGAPI